MHHNRTIWEPRYKKNYNSRHSIQLLDCFRGLENVGVAVLTCFTVGVAVLTCLTSSFLFRIGFHYHQYSTQYEKIAAKKIFFFKGECYWENDCPCQETESFLLLGKNNKLKNNKNTFCQKAPPSNSFYNVWTLMKWKLLSIYPMTQISQNFVFFFRTTNGIRIWQNILRQITTPTTC